MTKIIELRPDKSLMNSSFEKYQFSNEVVPIISKSKLKNHVYRLEPNRDQESWLEARLFAFHNHLFNNVYDMSCWFIDETSAVWRLDKDGSLDQVYKLYANTQSSKPTYNPSIGFTLNNIVAISDGGRNLHILIGYMEEKRKVFLINSEESGIVMNVQYIEEDKKIIITLCSITSDNNQKKYTQLLLMSYGLCVENEVTKIHNVDKQILKVQGTVDYAYVEENGNYLHAICQDNIAFDNKDTQESETKVKQPVESVSSQIKIPKYYWSQDEDSLTVWIKVPKQHSDKQPKINIKPLELSVIIDNEVLIQGECQHRLEENMATWRYKEDTVQIDLSKYESGLIWSELIKGDIEGECLPNEALSAEIHARLAHLCTDQQSNSVGGDEPCIGFNAEQLEECDLEGKENFVQRINLLTQATTHIAKLGSNNHVLFTYKGKHGQRVCLRYDHDACIWEMGNRNDGQWNLSHVLSFPGFGYVEASKTNKKFCVSPIDGSYIAIIEHTRHLFLYERPDIGAKSAKQRILELDCQTSPIMGVVATNNYLIVLSKDNLYRLQIRE